MEGAVRILRQPSSRKINQRIGEPDFPSQHDPECGFWERSRRQPRVGSILRSADVNGEIQLLRLSLCRPAKAHTSNSRSLKMVRSAGCGHRNDHKGHTIASGISCECYGGYSGRK